MDDNPQEVDIVMSVLMKDNIFRGWENFQAMDWSHEGGIHRCRQLRGELSRGFGCEGKIKAIDRRYILHTNSFQIKATLMAAVFLIDFMYFEKDD